MEGIDYKEVWVPVANLESICIILALAAKYDLELDQIDVATAYLNRKLQEELLLVPETFSVWSEAIRGHLISYWMANSIWS